MTQSDAKELGEIARSIEALFTGHEVLETTAGVASEQATQRHPDVATALGLEGELDANTEPDLTPPPGDTSEADPGTPADVEDRDLTPIEAEPAPSETGQALSEATSQYLEAPIHEREEAQRVLRAAVEASRSAGAFGEIASSVKVLILQGAGDSEVWALANEFIDGEVVAQMVVQVGRVGEVEELGDVQDQTL